MCQWNNGKVLIIAGLGMLAAAAFGTEPAREGAAEETWRRWAIIATPECEQAGIGDLLTAKLSRIEGVELVERALVGKVLAERKISASVFASAEAAIQLGRLLAADAFLVVERVPKLTPTACRLQVIETRTGIALGMEFLAEESLKEDVAPVARLVRASAAKLGVPVEKRHYVGLLSFRSEEPGRTLDGVAEALGMLLVNDLAASPGIVVLDREHLDALQKEEGLTGVELQLRTSALLVEGAIRRLPEGGRLAVVVLLPPRAGGEPRKVAASVPEGDIAEGRRLLVEAVGKAIGEARPQASTATLEEEAAVFLGRVRCLTSRNDTREAVRAAEAALALHPSQEARLAAAAAWQCRMWNLRAMVRRPVGAGSPATAGAMAEGKAQVARAYLRLLTLVLEALRYHVLDQDAAGEAGMRLPFNGFYFGQLEFSALPDEQAVQELCDEAEALEEAIFQFQIDYYAKRYDRCAGGYWLAWSRAMGGLYRGTLERRVEVVRRAADAFANPPGDRNELANRRLTHFALWPQQLQRFRPSDDLDAAERRARELYVQLCRDLGGHDDPYLRLVGYAGLICIGEDEVASARALLEAFARHFPANHPHRTKENDYMGFSQPVWRAALVLSLREPATLDAFCQQHLAPWIETRDAARLAAWHLVFSEWVNALRRLGRFEQLDAIAQGAHKVLVQHPTAWHGDQATRLARSLEQVRRECAEKFGRRPGADPAWTEYTLRPVPLGLDEAPAHLLLDGERLICVHESTVSNVGRGSVTASVILFNLRHGGQGKLLGRAALATEKPGRGHVTCAALGAETVYVGTGVGLVAFPLEGGEPKVMTEADGLPSNEVLSLAFYDGKLYIGFGPVMSLFGRAAFGCRGADGLFRLIASTSAAEERSGLDGGRSYRITAILADTERRCLWLGVKYIQGQGGRNGVWRYTPQSGKLEHVLPERFFIEDLAWSGKSVLCSVTHAGLVQIDPAMLSRTWLAAQNEAFVPTGCEAEAAFGSPQVGLWPASLDGERLITGGIRHQALYLLRKGSPPAALEQGPDGKPLSAIAHLLETPFGLLAVTGRGHAYLIRRKGSFQ